MADKRWLPRALNVPQVDTVTIANTWNTGDTVSVVINEKALTATIGTDDSNPQIATALAEMMAGDEETGTGDHTFSETGDNVDEFGELAPEASGSVVTVTGPKGVPFTLTASEVTAGSGTATQATATAATGENFWSDVDNWGGSAIPADTDVIYFDHGEVPVLYGLAQSAIEPAAMYVAMSYTGDIGLPEINDGGGYAEYRPTYLQIGPAVLQIGAGEGNGSGRIKIDTTTDQVALTVLNTGTSADELPAFIWKGTHASNALAMRNGSVGVAIFGGETATLASFTVDGGSLTLGSGVTLSGALVVNGGSVRIASKVDGSLTVNGGVVLIEGSADVDQLTIRGGTVILNTSGTLGGATVISGDGVLDLSQDSRPLTAVSAAIDMYGTNCQVLDPFKRLGNASFDLNEGTSVAQLNLGQNLRVTRAAVA